jgi:hypothetical protein
MLTHVEFRSDRFPPHEEEEAELNPGRWGKRLADFLRDGLISRGFSAGDPIAEDWGWVVPVENDRFPLWIGCGNYDVHPKDGFLCFIEPHTTTIRKLFRTINVSERVGQLRDAIDAVLDEEPTVRNKRWWTHDQFNRPDVQEEHAS